MPVQASGMPVQATGMSVQASGMPVQASGTHVQVRRRAFHLWEGSLFRTGRVLGIRLI